MMALLRIMALFTSFHGGNWNQQEGGWEGGWDGREGGGVGR